MKSDNIELKNNFYLAGSITFALRMVIGWTYFSAFWRRLVLENKLDEEAAGYIGEKFNHFLPNALGIKPIIEYLVLNPDALWWAMTLFTIVEAIVGLFLILGLFTRLMSIGVFALAMGILLGSGWLGTTCLDEWQIGVLGIAGGFTLFLSGSGKYSLDNWLMVKSYSFTNKKAYALLGSGNLPVQWYRFYKVVFAGSMFILFMTLFTNQYFHGGVYGTLHNKSVKPKVEISQAKIKNGMLSFIVNRVEGADVYGSFLIGITVVDKNNNPVFDLDGKALSQLPKTAIINKYVAKVKSGKHSMIIPLGAKAELQFKDKVFNNTDHQGFKVLLTDISGTIWESSIE
jgi:thiosulfate dehydrogenase [quinone] large subunit